MQYFSGEVEGGLVLLKLKCAAEMCLRPFFIPELFSKKGRLFLYTLQTIGTLLSTIVHLEIQDENTFYRKIVSLRLKNML